MRDDARYLRRRKARQRRAAARHLQPIRGAAGRQLRSRNLHARRVVGVGQFARGLTRRPSRPGSRVATWVLPALPVVVLLVWVVARMARHL